MINLTWNRKCRLALRKAEFPKGNKRHWHPVIAPRSLEPRGLQEDAPCSVCGTGIRCARLAGTETRGRERLLVGSRAGLALFRHHRLKTGQNQTFIRTDLTSEGEEGEQMVEVPQGEWRPPRCTPRAPLTIWS